MAVRNYLNTSIPVGLSAGVDDTTPTLPVPSSAGYPAAPFTLAMERGSGNQEFCLCTAKGPTSFTVLRGYGTPAVPHDITAPIEHCVGAIDYAEMNFHINDQDHNQHSQYVRKDMLGAKGSMYVALSDGVVQELEIGANGLALVANSALTLGVGWGSALPTASLVMYAGAAAPTGFYLCDGSLHTFGVGGTDDPLYQIIGTAYNTGGEGVNQFRLPDLRGRSPLGVGTGAGLTARTRGERGGAQSVALVLANLAQHNHVMTHGHSAGTASHRHGTPTSPVDYGARYVISIGGAQSNYLYDNGAPSGSRGQGVTFTGTSVEDPAITVNNMTGNTGTSPGSAATAHENMSPFLGVNFLIKR